tara:strand:- start:1693 stop:1914 length:222 start_codon:yes stop_codon:yes gene_type:complete
MKLSEAEKDYVEKTCNLYKDQRLADELTRIRYEMGIKDRVTIDQVRKARYRMGIEKKAGRGKCQAIKKETKDE